MLILAATADLLRVITTVGGAQLEAHVSFVEIDSAVPPVVQDVNLVNTANITTVTTTTILDCTTSGRKRRVMYADIRNNHASVSETCEVVHSDGTTVRSLIKCTLLAGEALVYNGAGTWLHYDTTGAIYPGVGNAVAQSDMEAGTANDKYVTPGRQHFHPGHPKCWGKATVAAGAPTLQASYNITSITDTATDQLTVTIANDFSGAHYVMQVSVEAATTTLSATTTSLLVFIRNATLAAGSFIIQACEIDVGSATDPASWHWLGCGDL